MIHRSFKSYIPFQTPSSIITYLDDYNKKFISRNIDYHKKRYPTHSRLLLSTRQNIADTNFLDNNNNQLFQLAQCSDGLPNIPDIKMGLFLFGLSSLFMFLLTKKY